MGEKKETLTIKQVHDNDKYIITNIAVEECTGAELVNYYEAIKAETDVAVTRIVQIPKNAEVQVKQNQDFLDKNKDRLAEFERFAKKIKEIAPKVAETIKYDEKEVKAPADSVDSKDKTNVPLDFEGVNMDAQAKESEMKIPDGQNLQPPNNP